MQPSLWSLGFLICMALTGIQPAFANSGLLNSTTSSASNLPLDGTNSSTTHIVKISTLALSTNSSKGFTVTISSGNITKIGQETPIAYNVTTLPSGTNAPSGADFSVTSGNNYTFATNEVGSQSRDLYIFYTPAKMQDPGVYNANIIVSIADNP
ncbi:MAG: hypothetical protein ACOYN8_17420 [Pseudanabaena sp.]